MERLPGARTHSTGLFLPLPRLTPSSYVGFSNGSFHSTVLQSPHTNFVSFCDDCTSLAIFANSLFTDPFLPLL